MPLPTPDYVAFHGVLAPPLPVARGQAMDEPFIAAVRDHFPQVASRQLLPDDAPSTAPHLMLQSNSSQLAVSAAQTDFQVRFYGDYTREPERCRAYVAAKLQTVLAAWNGIGVTPSFFGLVLTLQFPSGAEGIEFDPVAHICENHLRGDVDRDSIHDINVRVGMRVAERYFATLTASSYETKTLDRPLFPGAQVVVRPWEGTVAETGIQLTVDVNNRLEAINERGDPEVTPERLEAALSLLELVVSDMGLPYADEGASGVRIPAGQQVP